jgi:hypothetical protein
VNDLERDLRDLLTGDAEHVSTPASAPEGLRRRARLGQAAFASLSGLVVVAVVALGVWALGALPSRDAEIPADQPTTTQSMNGISVTFTESWFLIDPDEAGLNGSQPTRDLPRLVLALSPRAPSDLTACPGMVEGQPPTFLMTVQEAPRALEGAASAPWPAALEPMDIGSVTGGCYPGWEFLRAGWTTLGRTFEARLGLAPDISDEDRTAVFAAYDSMTFAETAEGPKSVVLTSGTTGGEDWQLIASSGPDGGLDLALQGETFGTGAGGFDPTSPELAPSVHVFGEGPLAPRVVFGAIPAEAVRVVGTDAASTQTEIPILDVPDAIDADLNAFVITMDPSLSPKQAMSFEAFDEQGSVVAHGSIGPEAGEPSGPPEATLEDGRHFGFIRSVDVGGRTIAFDLAYWLSGEEANQAYQEATGETGPVPNDHFVVNDNPTLRTLPLSPDLRLRLLDWNHCCETFFDGDLSLFEQAIATQEDVTDGDVRYAGVSQYWVTVENGVVTEIEEQYSP